MNVALWAEIRRLAEIEKCSCRAIARRLHCSRHTVAAALQLDQPPGREVSQRTSLLDPYKAKIDALLAKAPDLSAVRIREEISRGPEGYQGSAIVVRRYLRTIRPPRGRVYQEVHYEPAQAMQVDWGECGRVQIGGTTRKVSVFVAVLCYSRLMYIEFTLSQRKEEFYRGLVHALEFSGGLAFINARDQRFRIGEQTGTAPDGTTKLFAVDRVSDGDLSYKIAAFAHYTSVRHQWIGLAAGIGTDIPSGNTAPMVGFVLSAPTLPVVNKGNLIIGAAFAQSKRLKAQYEGVPSVPSTVTADALTEERSSVKFFVGISFGFFNGENKFKSLFPGQSTDTTPK